MQKKVVFLTKYIYISINVFFWPIGIFFSSGRGSFLVLSAPWHAGSPPGPRTQVWALAEVRGTCSGGSTWQVSSGRDSEHVEPSRPMQTHVHNTWYILTWVKKCPTAISMILNVVNVDRHYLLMERYFPDTQLARKATTFSTMRYNLHGLGRIFSSHARSCVEDETTRWLSLHLRRTSVRIQQRSK